MATRNRNGFEFDYGAQYFTAKSALFNEFIKPLIHLEIIDRWDAHFIELNSKKILNKKVWGESFPHYVGKPSMNRMCQNADISWISVNSSKPDRPDKPTLLIHSTNNWAEANMSTDRKIIIDHLLNELERVSDLDLPQAKCQILHYWRYANIGMQKNQDVFINFEQQLATYGDWCIQGRVESAFLAAHKVPNQILANIL